MLSVKKIFFIISFALFTLPLAAQEALDLTSCLKYALRNSPKIKSEALAQRKETEEQKEKTGKFLPQIDAYVDFNQYFNDLPTYIFPQAEGSNLAGQPITGPYPVPLGLPYNLNTGFNISQTIFDANFIGLKSKYRKFDEYHGIKMEIAGDELLYQTAQLFYQIAINKERLDYLDMNLERLAKLQSVVKLQVDQGFAKQTDYQKLIVKTSNLKSKRNKLEAGIRKQISYFKILIGYPQNEALELRFDVDETLILSAALPDSLDQLPETKLLSKQRELNQLNTKRLNANYLPKLKAYAGFLFQAQRESFNFFSSGYDWYNIHQWGIRLDVPIMKGFEKKSYNEISKIVDEQLVFGLEQKEVQIKVEYQSAVEELDAARAELAAQKENLDLAEKIYKQSELGYNQGTILLIDFLDSEAMLRESKMMYATALLDTRLAELKVLKATGGIRKLVNM